MIKGTYRLIDGIDTTQRIGVAKHHNDHVVYGSMELQPNVTYQLEDDEIFLNSLKSATVEKRYSDELIKTLKAMGIKYDLNYCRSCGGRVKKVVYSIIEVNQDEA